MYISKTVIGGRTKNKYEAFSFPDEQILIDWLRKHYVVVKRFEIIEIEVNIK